MVKESAVDLILSIALIETWLLYNKNPLSSSQVRMSGFNPVFPGSNPGNGCFASVSLVKAVNCPVGDHKNKLSCAFNSW